MRRLEPHIHSIRSLYESGKSLREIAEFYDAEHSLVRQEMARHGIPRRPNFCRGTRMLKDRVAEISALYQAGLPAQAVGDIVGASDNTVLNELRRNGVETRPSRPPPPRQRRGNWVDTLSAADRSWFYKLARVYGWKAARRMFIAEFAKSGDADLRSGSQSAPKSPRKGHGAGGSDGNAVRQ